jgi:hypothetical protein
VVPDACAQTTTQQTMTSPTSTSNASIYKSHDDFINFLNYVACINVSPYNISAFHMSTSQVMGSQKNQTTISAIVNYNHANLSVAMILIDGKVRFYDLGMLSGTLGSEVSSFSDSLNSAKSAIVNYARFFNSKCSGFDQLVPKNSPAQNLTTNSVNGIKLNIQTVSDPESKIENTKLGWYQTVDGITVAGQSVQATVSSNGLLTSFADSIGLYKIATTKTMISKQQAIAISMPYINAYATANHREVKIVNATLQYLADMTETRGDSFLIYPQWSVKATFDTGNNDVYGYTTLIWADNAEIQSEGPQAYFHPISTSSSLNITILASIVTLAFTPFIVGFVYIGRQKRNSQWTRKGIVKIVCILMTSIILTSPILIQPVSANTSGVFGSTANVNDQTEIDLDTSLTSNITNWAESSGLTSLNYYGTNTVASYLYYGARGFGDTYGLAFYIGHANSSPNYCSALYY